MLLWLIHVIEAFVTNMDISTYLMLYHNSNFKQHL